MKLIIKYMEELISDRTKKSKISSIAQTEKLEINAKRIIKERKDNINVYVSDLDEEHIITKDLAKKVVRQKLEKNYRIKANEVWTG